MTRDNRWADQDGVTGGPEPDDAMHPIAWLERTVQRRTSTLTVDEFVHALDPPETDHQHQHEVRWLPELVYDDRGWPPAIEVFYD
jgi:hypothetical protein